MTIEWPTSTCWTGLNLNELHQAAQGGDRQAENRLFEILTVRVRRFAYQRVWTEEAAQEVAQEALAVVARDYRDIQVHTSFAAWAHRVLENRLLAHFRARQSESRRQSDIIDIGETRGGQEETPGLKARLAECLRLILSSNRRYARILNFRYQGYKTGEICSRLNITANNCYVMLSRARDSLERCLKGESTES